jgi:hypothetical protein
MSVLNRATDLENPIYCREFIDGTVCESRGQVAAADELHDDKHGTGGRQTNSVNSDNMIVLKRVDQARFADKACDELRFMN